jgi:hypothetical protein
MVVTLKEKTTKTCRQNVALRVSQLHTDIPHIYVQISHMVSHLRLSD